MSKSDIESIANQVLIKYVPKGGAFKQFDKICAGENIKYIEIEADENMFCGAFTKYLNEQKYIIINSNINNEGRKNFTKAHELGHYFLHHHLKTNMIDKSINEECLNKESIEYEADYFATCLLMPEEKITSAVKSILFNLTKGPTMPFIVSTKNYRTWAVISKDLTKRYGVSETALRYRLLTLNLVIFH